jgi:hypothetical protein
MTTGSTGSRRTLLQRGIALLAGGAALAGGTRWAAAASPSPLAPVKVEGATLTLYARRRPAASAADGRMVTSGDVFDRPGGERIGSFHTTSFHAHSPFGGPSATASSLEFHVLQLKDGTLFSVSSGAAGDGARALAIIGGTDRFAGKSGNYLERAIAGDYPGDDLRELTITFAG